MAPETAACAPPRRPASRSGALLALLLLLACALAVYTNALFHPFLGDDHPAIRLDPRVQAGEWAAIFRGGYWSQPGADPLYRPLLKASFALNWLISQQPWTFRLPNMLGHAMAGCLVFWLGRRLGAAVWAAAIGAAAFAVHPIHCDAVNPIVGRAEIGAAVFGLLALHLLWPGSAPRRAWLRHLAGAACFGAALLFKESAAAIIGVVLVADFWSHRQPGQGRPRLRTTVARYVGLLVVLAGVLTLRVTVLGTLTRPAESISPLDNILAHPAYGLEPGGNEAVARWATPLAVFAKAVRLLLWPHPLACDYSYAAITPAHSAAEPSVVLGAALLAGCILAMACFFRRRGLTLFALGFLLVTYSIVSNTFVLIGVTFAERLLYLPSIGWCLLLTGAAQAALHAARGPAVWLRTCGRAALVGLLLVVAAYAGLTLDRNRAFASERLLYATDVQTNPRSARLWASAAVEAFNRGEYARAVESAERAIEIFPEYPLAWRMAGLGRFRLGQTDPALTGLLKSIDLGGATDENACVVAAALLKRHGDYERAIALLDLFAATGRASALVYNNLAWYRLTAEPADLRDLDRALYDARRAVQLDPSAGDFLDTYVRVLQVLGRADEARQVIEEGLRHIPPNDPQRAALLEELHRP